MVIERNNFVILKIYFNFFYIGLKYWKWEEGGGYVLNVFNFNFRFKFVKVCIILYICN